MNIALLLLVLGIGRRIVSPHRVAAPRRVRVWGLKYSLLAASLNRQPGAPDDWLGH
jgi:hypothetical protein